MIRGIERFHGRTAVITGAGSGIGRALALELARAGACLALSDVNTADVEYTAARCRVRGSDARAYTLNVADRDGVFAHAKEVMRDFGGVALVINNAGVAMSGSVQDTGIDDFRWLMEIDFYGVLHGTQAFLPHLIASGDGYLVNISSIFGLIAVPKQAPYNAAKFAVRGLTEALRLEMAVGNLPVTVSCVHPGGIRTNIARSARSAPETSENLAATFDRLAVTSPERAARVILRGSIRGKPRILIGADAWGVALMSRALGGRYLPLVASVTKRLSY
jgi:NAD(P)-dependent dehydrogenase (short-subunit alcohol dehydrogenase family)